jgi:putative protease
MEHELGEVRERLSAAARRGARYGLISNLSHFALCREAGLIPIGDFRMNPYNVASAAVLRALGAERVLASLELTPPRAASVGGVLAYGRAPLMLTERCFVRENAGCAACQSFAFTDRRGMRFPVLREYVHRNLIFNSVPTYMGDKKEELARYRISHHHFIFSDESAAEIRRILAVYQSGAPLNGQVRRIGVSEAKVYDGEKGASAQERKVEKTQNKPPKTPPRRTCEREKHAEKNRYPSAREKNKPNNGKKRK